MESSRCITGFSTFMEGCINVIGMVLFLFMKQIKAITMFIMSIKSSTFLRCVYHVVVVHLSDQLGSGVDT